MEGRRRLAAVFGRRGNRDAREAVAAVPRLTLLPFWLNALMLFGAMRLADALNAVTGLWVIPRGLAPGALGAVLPLMSFGALLALPASVLATVFARHLCAYAAAGDGERLRGLLRDALAASFALLLVALGVASMLMPWLCEALRVPHSPAGYLAVGYGLLAAFVPLTTAALQALGRFGALSVAALGAAPARLAAMVALLPVAGLSGYFVGQAVPLLTNVAVAVFVLRGLLFGRASRAWRADLRPMARYALWVAVGAGAGALQGMAASFAIRHRLTDDASAAYYLISRFAEIATYCGSTLGAVLFPYAVAARVRGEPSRGLRDGVLGALLGGGVVLALALWAGLPWLFARLPGYAPYVPYAPWAGYLTLAVTLNAVSAGHFAHANARDDFRYLRYAVPLSLVAAALFLTLPCRTLAGMLHVLFFTAAVQALCVGADVFWERRNGKGGRHEGE